MARLFLVAALLLLCATSPIAVTALGTPHCVGLREYGGLCSNNAASCVTEQRCNAASGENAGKVCCDASKTSVLEGEDYCAVDEADALLGQSPYVDCSPGECVGSARQNNDCTFPFTYPADSGNLFYDCTTIDNGDNDGQSWCMINGAVWGFCGGCEETPAPTAPTGAPSLAPTPAPTGAPSPLDSWLSWDLARPEAAAASGDDGAAHGDVVVGTGRVPLDGVLAGSAAYLQDGDVGVALGGGGPDAPASSSFVNMSAPVVVRAHPHPERPAELKMGPLGFSFWLRRREGAGAYETVLNLASADGADHLRFGTAPGGRAFLNASYGYVGAPASVATSNAVFCDAGEWCHYAVELRTTGRWEYEWEGAFYVHVRRCEGNYENPSGPPNGGPPNAARQQWREDGTPQPAEDDTERGAAAAYRAEFVPNLEVNDGRAAIHAWREDFKLHKRCRCMSHADAACQQYVSAVLCEEDGLISEGHVNNTMCWQCRTRGAHADDEAAAYPGFEPAATYAHLQLGRRFGGAGVPAGGDQQLRGDVALVRLYDRGLTDGQHAIDFEAGTATSVCPAAGGGDVFNGGMGAHAPVATVAAAIVGSGLLLLL